MATLPNKFNNRSITKKREKRMKSEQVEKSLRSAKASLAVEGLHVTENEEALVKARLNGEITESEFKQKVMDLINE
ncbi:antitoxin VbhA family protein [Cytobacillus sp. FJAT-54145]|uniref:Antitoxin VbhA family protein n=1 Tax=Cytobacillus spartinae TaxID=3299023 RepID=A0ABW6KM30_9BACI